MKKTNLKKLLTFIIAAMMFSVNAYSQIVYMDVNPDTTVMTNYAIYNLDLNNDGIVDFKIKKSYFYSCPQFGSYGFTTTSIDINALNGNEVSNDSNNYPKKISYNNIIKSGSTNWMNTANQLLAKKANQVTKGRFQCFTSSVTTYSGNWNAANDKYVGLRLIIGVNKYYGWVRLNVANGGNSVTIKDYAYDSTPNHSIHAGATSGARLAYNLFTKNIYSRDYLSDSKNNSATGNQSRLTSSCIKSQRTVGGTGDDFYGNILALQNGFIVCGYTNSGDGDFNVPANRSVDAYIARFNNSGNLVWQHTFGGSGDDGFEHIIQTADGGFMAAGWTSSNDCDVSGNHGGDEDVWIMKLNSQGQKQWQKCLGGSGDDFGTNIEKTPFGYAFAAFSNSTDGQVSNNHGDYDAWVVRLSPFGNILWQNSYGGSDYEHTSGFAVNNDGTLMLGVSTFSIDGDIGSGGFGGQDGWIAKIGIFGNIIWQRRLGGSGEEYQNAFTKTADGNIVIPFGTNSIDGDVTNNQGGYDFWVVKVNSQNGSIIWQMNYGGASDQAAIKLFETLNGDLVTTGLTGDATNPSALDIEIVRTDANGNLKWDNIFGGSDEEIGFGGIEANNGKLIILAYTRSSDGDVQNNHGGYDTWLFKLGNCSQQREPGIESGNSGLQKLSLNCFPNPLSNTATISFSPDKSGKVSLKVFDMTGRWVRTLVNGGVQEGPQQIIWNATDEKGDPVNAGIYFLKLETENYSETRKLSVVR